LNEVSFNLIIDKFGKQRIENRHQVIKNILESFILHHQCVLQKSIDETAQYLNFNSFYLLLNFTKPFIKDDNLTNIYKISSNLIYTILLSDIFDSRIQNSTNHKLLRSKLAMYAFSQFISNFDNRNFNFFENYLNTNSELVNTEFDNLQNNYAYYLKYVDFTDNDKVPIILNSLFLESIFKWLSFSGDVTNFSSHGL
jgi:hypothetical protein